MLLMVLRIALLFLLTISTTPAAAFSNSDLAGTWYIFDFFDHPSSNDPGWTRGTVTIRYRYRRHPRK
jgi:hypothetical protein